MIFGTGNSKWNHSDYELSGLIPFEYGKWKESCIGFPIGIVALGFFSPYFSGSVGYFWLHLSGTRGGVFRQSRKVVVGI